MKQKTTALPGELARLNPARHRNRFNKTEDKKNRHNNEESARGPNQPDAQKATHSALYFDTTAVTFCPVYASSIQTDDFSLDSSPLTLYT